MFRSTGGFSKLVFSNRITTQVSGDAFWHLDEFDIKNILNRIIYACYEAKRFDLEGVIEREPITSVGRIDSQITIAIKPEDISDYFNLKSFKNRNGKLTSYFKNLNNESNFTGISWFKNPAKDYYQLGSDLLMKEPQPDFKKIDFFRIYDKILETIETTLPFSEKRISMIEKYKEFINRGYRIFRIEIEERENRLTANHLCAILDESNATFNEICEERFKRFMKRNHFDFWNTLEESGALEKPQIIHKW